MPDYLATRIRQALADAARPMSTEQIAEALGSDYVKTKAAIAALKRNRRVDIATTVQCRGGNRAFYVLVPQTVGRKPTPTEAHAADLARRRDAKRKRKETDRLVDSLLQRRRRTPMLWTARAIAGLRPLEHARQ